MKLNYAVVGTNDMEAAQAFYDRLLDGFGMTRVCPSPRMTYWLGSEFALAAAIPFDEAPASSGNGTMIGFCVGTMENVAHLHARALALGGTSEGAPGQRGPRFSAYVRDPDQNKLCFSD